MFTDMDYKYSYYVTHAATGNLITSCVASQQSCQSFQTDPLEAATYVVYVLNKKGKIVCKQEVVIGENDKSKKSLPLTNGLSSEVMVHPNPVRSELFVQLADSLPDNASFDWQVLDAQGRSHIQSKQQRDARFSIRTDALAPGLYLLQIRRSNGSVSVTRFVVQ